MMQEWGCNGRIFLENGAQNSYVILGCIGLPRGVKWCKSEGVKDKLTAHSYIFFGLPRGVKRCKSSGVICLLPPHPYTILHPLEAQCSPKRCKSFELHFPKKILPLQPHSYIIYPPWQPNSYIILPPPPPGSPTLTTFYPLDLTFF